MTMRDNIAIKPQMKMERRHMTSSETMKHFVGEKRVNSSSLEERRDRLDILLAMLQVAKEPIKKTHILYTTKINFYQLSRHLDFLMKTGMIEEITSPLEGYRTTEKGRTVLSLFFGQD